MQAVEGLQNAITQKTTMLGLINIGRLAPECTSKERMREANVLAFHQPRLTREQLGGSAVKGSGYLGFNMNIQL